ncbi:MAG: 50S ribosome-binding GTPase [Victivallaceae bacterium]|nr:50S ribosome-binding GTPase [Victivallaceae bacterium]
MEQEIRDAEQEILKRFEADRKNYKRPNILVCGYTGNGKTSLIQTILGKELVAQDKIGAGKPVTRGFDVYENENVRIWDSRGFEMGGDESAFHDQISDFVRERQNAPDVEEHVHLVWYAISGVRVTDCDKHLISTVFDPKHLIVVLTKCDTLRPSQREAMKKEILTTGISEERILFTSDAESGSIGCKELMELSYRMIPDAYKDAFMAAQAIDMEAKIKAVQAKKGKANAAIVAAVATATGVGAVPLPLSDALLITPAQLGLIAYLASLYGLKTEAMKTAALPFLAKMAGKLTVSSLLKFIPFGSVVSSAVAGTLTAAMGWYVQGKFESMAIAKIKGEPVSEPNFDISTFMTYYNNYKDHKE